jgi:hypothetical protein
LSINVPASGVPILALLVLFSGHLHPYMNLYVTKHTLQVFLL